MCLPWLACTVYRPFFIIFWFPFPLWLVLFKVRPCLMVGFAFLQPTFFPTTISYHTTLSFLLRSCLALIWLGLFGLAIYSSPNGLARLLVLLLYHWWALMSHLFSLGRLGPVCFPWAFSALFLTLHSHGLLLNYLGFPSSITLFLILGVHRSAINPLLSLLSLLWTYRGPFSLFDIIYCPWFAFSLFPGSFKPIYFLKAHLFTSWACDPLFLPLGLNEFSIHLPTLFCSCYWASPFHLGFRNGHQQ